MNYISLKMVKRRGGGTWCCVPLCYNNNMNREEKITFFGIPKDNEKALKWLVEIGRVELVGLKYSKLQTYKVCKKHFSPKAFSNTLQNRLLPSAVPSLHLPGMSTTAEPPMQIPSTSQTCFEISTENVANPSNIRALSPALSTNTLVIKRELETPFTCSIATQTPVILSSYSIRKEKLTTEIGMEREKKRTTSTSDVGTEIALLKKLSKKYFSPNLATLVELQCNSMDKKVQGRRLSKKSKQTALKIYFLGPRYYRFMQRLMSLPSISTLQRITTNWCISTGFNKNVFDLIKIKMQDYPMDARDSVLTMDELSLKANLFYNIKTDEIFGFHQTDSSKKNCAAKFAFVLMLRGIHKKWKQQVGYVLTESSCTDDELAFFLKSVVINLRQCGCFVRAISSDMGSNFVKFARNHGVKQDSTFINIGGENVYYIFDVPHLLKATRNNFLKYSYAYEGKETNSKYVKTFFEGGGKESLRLAYKLTENHINPTNLEKTRVELAAQLLSERVAAGMLTYKKCGYLPIESIATIEFIHRIDKLFDVLNSSNSAAQKMFNRPFKGEKEILEFLEDCLKFWKYVKILNSQRLDITNKLRTVWCWQITIRSVLNLWQDLGKPTLFTRRLNLDALENFFDSIRQQCGNSRNPTPIQFQRAYKKLFCTDYFLYSEFGNRFEDFDNVLAKVQRANVIRETTFDEDSTVQHSFELLVTDTDYRNLDFIAQNEFTYVCGYLLYKCLKKHTCDICCSYASCEIDSKDAQESVCGISKLTPTDFCHYVNELENIFINHFSDACLQNVGNTMKNLMKPISLSHPCKNFPYDYVLNLFIRFRIFTAVKFINRAFLKIQNRYKIGDIIHI